MKNYRDQLSRVLPYLVLMSLNWAVPLCAVPSGGPSLPHLALTSSAGLEVIAGDGTIPINSSIARYNFAELTTLDRAAIAHTFRLRQNGKAVVTIDRIETSCGCTRAVLEGSAKLPITLAPQEEVRVHVSVDPMQLLPGTLTKTVSIYVNGQIVPAARLEMQGVLHSAAYFSPPVIDFGRCGPQHISPILVTVFFDPRLLHSGKLPNIVSSNPDVCVTPDDAPVSINPKDSSGQGIFRAQVYRVSLGRHPSTGLVDGVLSISADPDTPYGVDGRWFAVASLVGEVVGNMFASPKAIILNGLKRNQEPKRHIFITSADSKFLDRLSVSCSNPSVMVRIIPRAPGSEMASNSVSRIVEVTVKPIGPVQTIKTEIRVMAETREQLRIPVFVTINPIASR